jgi:hypothetical protein
MAERTPSRGSRAWQVQSVWVKRREGPERGLSAYRFLLDLPPPRALREVGALGAPPKPEQRPAGVERAGGASSLTSPESAGPLEDH